MLAVHKIIVGLARVYIDTAILTVTCNFSKVSLDAVMFDENNRHYLLGILNRLYKPAV